MILLAYNANYLTEPNIWDSKAHSLFVFRTIEFLEIDLKNMFTSLLYMADFMRSKKTLKDKVNDIPKLKGFDKATWSFLSSNF